MVLMKDAGKLAGELTLDLVFALLLLLLLLCRFARSPASRFLPYCYNDSGFPASS